MLEYYTILCTIIQSRFYQRNNSNQMFEVFYIFPYSYFLSLIHYLLQVYLRGPFPILSFLLETCFILSVELLGIHKMTSVRYFIFNICNIDIQSSFRS